jgi:hypothetical protein
VSQPPEYTEEELRALEAEMERITVDDVLLQTIVSLINLTARKAGLAAPPGEGPAPDWEQVRLGVEAVRALLPLVEPRHGAQLGAIRDGLSRLQMYYAQHAGEGAPAPAPEGGEASPPPQQPKPSPAASRLWIPGQ